MACAAEHAAFNFVAVTTAAAMVRQQEGKPVDGSTIMAGVASACLPSLPDMLEPALHPNHRKFFHSVAFAMTLGYVMRRIYQWETEGPVEQLTRVVLLVGGAAYLAHLARDAFTAKSLPLV